MISDVTKKEGKAGNLTAFVFTVTLSGTALDPVTMNFATADGTAVSVGLNPDYIPAIGTLTIPAGSNLKTITVSVIGDNRKEPNETFYVKISNPSPNAYLGDTQATGTILNDD